MDFNKNHGFSTWKFWKRRRHIVATLSFLGFLIAYVLRVNLSVAVVKMTSNRTIVDENGETNYGREFEWDSKLQGLVLSSFFYGYIATPLPGGWIAARIGGARIFGLGIAATALLTIISPFIARWSVYGLIAVRAIEGIFEGGTYPAMNEILSHWAPLLERSKLATAIYTGSKIGIVLGILLCSIMAERLDWPSLFYIPGVAGILWYICWCLIVKDRPEDDPHISKSELDYINNNLDIVKNKRISHPWKAILTSVPVWTIVIANAAENWGFYTMVAYLPKFMSEALGFPLEQGGVYACLPYLLSAILMFSAGQLADYLRSKKILTTTQVRKTFTCSAFVCQSFFMACTAFMMTPMVAVICIILSVGFGGLTIAGYSVNYLDVAGKHASIVTGISGYIIFLPGIISPIVTGYILQNETVDEWQTVFLITSGVYLFGALVYGIFASAEEQPWTKSGTQDLTGFDNPACIETY